MASIAEVQTRRAGSTGWVVLVIGVALLLMGTTLILGADLMWAVALGRDIAHRGGVPDGLPFAAAPTAGWPNVPVVGELLLAGVDRFGSLGLALLQITAGVASWALLAHCARTRGAGDAATAVVLAVVIAGSLAAWGVVRLQLLSLAPFAAALLIVHRQHRKPTRSVWVLPLLVAVWGNLHGAVLLGVCVIGAYLLGSRLRVEPWGAVGVGLTCLGALFVNPALGRTIDYYLGVLTNEAARARTHLWAPPSLTNPLDVLLIGAALTLVVLAIMGRPAVWEWLALAGLLVATVGAARNGLWLLLVLSAPAAAGGSALWVRVITRRQSSPASPSSRVRLILGVVLAVTGLVVLGGRRGALPPSDPAVVSAVAAAAGGRVVLAPEPLAESLAVAGARVWACDPIDAFDPADQRSYLAFLSGAGDWRSAADESAVIVLPVGHAATPDVPASFTATLAPPGWHIWIRS